MASLKTEVKAIKSLMESQAQEQARANSQPQNGGYSVNFWGRGSKGYQKTKNVIRIKLSNLNNPNCHHPTNRRQANLDLLEVLPRGTVP